MSPGNPLRCPIEMASFTEVQARVVYKLIAIACDRARRNGRPITVSTCFEVCDILRKGGFNCLYFCALSASKHVLWGGKLMDWRNAYPKLPAGRAAHKQRTH